MPSNLVPGKTVHIRRQVYLDLTTIMEQDGTFDDCRDALVWLRTASTARGGGGGAHSGVPSVSLSFPGVHLPQPVYQYVASKIYSDLPALREGHPLAATEQPTWLQPNKWPSSCGLWRRPHQRANDGVQDREPKQVQDVYRETYLLLLRHNRVEHTEDLAPIWRRLANSAK
jgi:hypothetical protein